ncbi:MAG: hypothetical protein L0I84_05280 [Halomonas subglaciescola]|nr:hypothetical protein [Halomonas subglaciescola]
MTGQSDLDPMITPTTGGLSDAMTLLSSEFALRKKIQAHSLPARRHLRASAADEIFLRRALKSRPLSGIVNGATSCQWRLMSTARSSAHAELTDPPRTSPDDFDVRELEKRTRLMRIITRLMAISDLGSREIARRAGLPVQKVSDLLAGRLEHLHADELNVLRRTLEPEAPLH